ncbi:hypothetical protein EW145_g621 [Phellinidium pouzarii]|uniref:PCI domain-containing protein n=1 Tax=Phellinidium pouzarii TaxID=167371 RepID=A0A4S4LHJ6_9AGAM|nr:hypothetical protein EW145_g621 [Phellinidium pouzarii]
MTITFTEYLSMLGTAVLQQQGPHLAYLLRPTSPHAKDFTKEFRNPTRQMLSAYEGSLVAPWDEIAISYALVVNFISNNKSADAFKEHSQLVSLFYRFFTNNTGWTLSALFAILRDLRDIAYDADIATQKTDCMEEAARIITKAFSHCVTDRSSPAAESRKWGVYYAVGLVIKCYFRVKRIALSRNILRALEANKDIPPLSSYPRAHQVTYRYYIGVIAFLNEDFEKAEQELTYSFYNCHADAQMNQQRILSYLIPLRILRGHLPSDNLLERFPLLAEVYNPFIAAIRKADIKAYDVALFKWEKRLLELNAWLVFERARELVMRGLFRKVYNEHRKFWSGSGSLQPITDGFLDLALALPWPNPFPPYASTIILTTVLSRLIFTLPFSIWAKRRQWRLEEMAVPELKAYRKDAAVHIAHEMKFAGLDKLGLAHFKKVHLERLRHAIDIRRRELFATYSCSPMPTMLVPAITQLPLFVFSTTVSSSLAMRPTPLDDETFLTLTSLARPDSTGMLPIALGLITLANVETGGWFVGAERVARSARIEEERKTLDAQKREQGIPVIPHIKDVVQGSLRLFSVLRIVIGVMVDGSIIVYWLSSATFGLFQSWGFNWWDAHRAAGRKRLSERQSQQSQDATPTSHKR